MKQKFQPTDPSSQLKALAWVHYALAAIICYIGLIALIHVLAQGFTSGWELATTSGNGFALMGLFSGFTLTASTIVMAVSSVIAGLLFYTGRSLEQTRNRAFCLVVSANQCLNFPIGTFLGLATASVLLRPSVKKQFANHTSP